jgi:hypothetical protein
MDKQGFTLLNPPKAEPHSGYLTGLTGFLKGLY